MPTINRDAQIKFMMNSEERHRALVDACLRVSEIATAAKRSAFDDEAPEPTSKVGRVARRG